MHYYAFFLFLALDNDEAIHTVYPGETRMSILLRAKEWSIESSKKGYYQEDEIINGITKEIEILKNNRNTDSN
jgi:hypothetical protein